MRGMTAALAPLPELFPSAAGAPLRAVEDARPADEDALARAEQALEEQRHTDALECLAGVASGTLEPAVAFRALIAESRAVLALGRIEEASSLLERARALSEGPGFGELDRAEALYRLACCRQAASAHANAAALLTVALELCDRAPLTSDRLRARVLERRSRCYVHQRDWPAARADVERAIELADSLGDERTAALAYFQASVIAERERQWMLAQFYAEQALELAERTRDTLSTGKILNNLGGISFLLGRAEDARDFLARAYQVALDDGNDVDAGYAVGSLAQVELRTGNAEAAEKHARRALVLLDGRPDHLLEAAGTRLVLGRALLDRGRLDEAERELVAAEASFELLASVSHVAKARVARGDAARARGACEAAAELYREAAELLADSHF